MYITSKKYTKEGRTRFGSAIFIDDLKEERIDSIEGIKRDRAILITAIILFLIKLLAANMVGIILTVSVLVMMYFKGERKITVSYTKHRMLIEEEFNSIRFARITGNLLIVISILVILRLILPGPDGFDTRIENMAIIFQFLNLYDNRFFAYRALVSNNFELFTVLDATLTLCIAIWFVFQYKKTDFQFKEINLNHVREQLIRMTSINSIQEFISLVLAYTIIQFLYFNRFSILFLLTILFLFQIIPRQKVVEFSLVGPSNRPILKSMIIPDLQISNLSRVTAVTFGWAPQKEQAREFPENIVPKEVSSIYETGLRAYSSEAYRQSNLLGLIISTITNIMVFIAIIRYAIINNVSNLSIIFIVVIELIAFSIVMFFVIAGINKLRLKSQKDEKLLIGEKFLGRFTGNSLWILSGKSTEGTTVQRGNASQLIRFDKAKGIIIAWERFTFLIIFAILFVIISIWTSLGAINLGAIPRLFPSLFDLGIQFLERKATADLDFFLISGYVLWAATIILYPRYYARTRPSLFIDMEYASIEPIVLKDFKEHQKASMQFTKSLISASVSDRKLSSMRPGAFILSLIVNGQLGEGNLLKFYIGENHRIVELDLPLEADHVVENHLPVSGMKGYAELPLVIELHNQNNDCLFTQSHTFQLLYSKQETIDLEFGIFGSIQLTVTIKKQKA